MGPHMFDQIAPLYSSELTEITCMMRLTTVTPLMHPHMFLTVEAPRAMGTQIFRMCEHVSLQL